MHAPHEARLTPAAGEVLLRAEGLRRRFGARTVVDGVEFEGRRGEVLGLLGPNGAGKTTTLRMLAGLLAPTDGRVTLHGRDLARDVAAPRRVLAYLPEQAALYEEMTVTGYLRFMARVWGARRSTIGAAVDRVLDDVEIGDVQKQVIGTLSRGYRQRVALGPPATLDRRTATRGIRVAVSGATDDEVRARFAAIEGVDAVAVADGVVHVTSTADVRAAIGRAVHDAGWQLLELTEESPDLEDVFLELTDEP